MPVKLEKGDSSGENEFLNQAIIFVYKFSHKPGQTIGYYESINEASRHRILFF